MASVTRKRTSPFWIACFTDSQGKQRQWSTKTTDKMRALRIAEQNEHAYRTGLTESKARRMISDIYRDLTGESLASTAIRDYLESWLKLKANEMATAAHSRYAAAVRKFISFLGPRADKDLRTITTRDIAEFRDSIAKRLSPTSANTDLKVLRIALGHACRDRVLADNPAANVGVIKPKGERTQRRPFTVGELRKLLQVADREWRGLILFGLYTGQRLGDIARIRWANIDVKAKEVQITSKKTERRTLVPLAKPVLAFLEQSEAPSTPDSYLFPAAWKQVDKASGETRRLSNQFHALMVRAKLVSKRSHARTGRGHAGPRKISPLSFHSLRHTTTSLLKNAGVSESVAMDIVGHDSREISRNYTHIDSGAKRAAMNRLPDVTR